MGVESLRDASRAGQGLLEQNAPSESREHQLHEAGYEDDNIGLSDILQEIHIQTLSSHNVNRLCD